MKVMRRAVCMTVNQALAVVPTESVFDRRCGYIHDVQGLRAFCLFAAFPQDLSFRPAFTQWFCEKISLPFDTAHLGTKILILGVIRAKRITMHQQRARSI
jgi:hypothetical protein